MAARLLARCALGQGDESQAEQLLEQAAEQLEQDDLPTVSLRISALEEDWQRSQAGVNQLLAGLETAPELAECFRQSAAVQAELQHVPISPG